MSINDNDSYKSAHDGHDNVAFMPDSSEPTILVHFSFVLFAIIKQNAQAPSLPSTESDQSPHVLALSYTPMQSTEL